MTTSVPSTPILETPRLILRPLVLADGDEVQPLIAQWGHRPSSQRTRALALPAQWCPHLLPRLSLALDSALPAIERGEQWHWMLHLKDDPAKKIIASICLVLRGPVNRGF